MKILNLTIKRVSVVMGFSTDRVNLETGDLPSPYTDAALAAPLCLGFDVSPGLGVAYCRENLGLEPDEVIHRSFGSIPGPDFMGNLKKLQEKK